MSLLLMHIRPTSSKPLRLVEFDAQLRNETIEFYRTLTALRSTCKLFHCSVSLATLAESFHPFAILAFFCHFYSTTPLPLPCSSYSPHLPLGHPPVHYFCDKTYSKLCAIGNHAALVGVQYPFIKNYLVCYACFAFVSSLPFPTMDHSIPFNCSANPNLICQQCGRLGDSYVTQFHSDHSRTAYIKALQQNETIWHQYIVFKQLTREPLSQMNFRSWEQLHGVLYQKVGYMCRDYDCNIYTSVAASLAQLDDQKPFQSGRKRYRNPPKCSLASLQNIRAFNRHVENDSLDTSETLHPDTTVPDNDAYMIDYYYALNDNTT